MMTASSNRRPMPPGRRRLRAALVATTAILAPYAPSAHAQDSAVIGPALSTLTTSVIQFDFKENKSQFRLISLPVFEGLWFDVRKSGDARSIDWGILQSPIATFIDFSRRNNPRSMTQLSRHTFTLLQLPFLSFLKVDRRVTPALGGQGEPTTYTSVQFLDLPFVGPLLSVKNGKKGPDVTSALLFGL